MQKFIQQFLETVDYKNIIKIMWVIIKGVTNYDVEEN